MKLINMYSVATQQYLKQFSYSFIIKIGSILISLFYVPIVLGYLSVEKYGIWIALSTIINWMRLFDIGVGNGLRNKLAEAIALNKKEKGKQLVSTAYFTLGIVFFGLTLILLAVNPFIPWSRLLNTQLISYNELLGLTSIVISFVLMGFVFQMVAIVHNAHGNSSIPNLIQLVISIISLILVYAATLFAEPENILLISFILSGTPVLVYLVYSYYTFYIKYPHFRPSWSAFQLKNSSALFKLSGQFFVVQITATILFASIPFIVTQFYGPAQVTQFQIASTIFNLPILIIGLVTGPVTPLVTQEYAKQEFGWIKNMLKRMNFTAYGIALFTLLMILFAPFIYKIWLGDKVEIPRTLSVAVGVYAIINVLVFPFSTFINAIGKIKILVILAPLGVSMFIGGCFIFDHLLKDVYSISIALSFSSILGLFVLPPVINKALMTKNT